MSEKKPSINIYEVYDNELARMHALLIHYMQLPTENNYSRVTGPSSSQYNQMSTIYKRLLEMQTHLIDAFKGRDEVIQNKVAELALTGDSESDPK